MWGETLKTLSNKKTYSEKEVQWERIEAEEEVEEESSLLTSKVWAES